MQVMHAASLPEKTRSGPKRKYPLHTMDVDTFFFLPGKERSTFDTYVSHQGRLLNRKFSTRIQRMRQVSAGRWEVAQDNDPSGVVGLAIYRTA